MSWEVPTMQSKTSCFNKTLFRKHVTRFWPIWTAYFASWLLILPLGLLGARDHIALDPFYVQQRVLDVIGGFGIIMAMVFAVLAAMGVWSFLYSSRSASGAACLPLTRTAQFWSAALGGLAPLIGVNVLVFLLTALAELSLGALHLPSLLTWLGMTVLLLLFFYGFAAFCAMLTGNIIVLPAVYLVLNFTAAGFILLLTGVSNWFLYGITGSNWGSSASFLEYLSPAIPMIRHIGSAVSWETDEATGIISRVTEVTFRGWGVAAIYAVVGVLLLVAAWALLRRRKMETAGDVVAVQVLKPVFRWCMGIGGALCFACGMLYVFNLTGTSQISILALTAAYFVIGSFIGWFAGEMLIRRSFRAFSGGMRGWGGWAICCAVLLLCLAATEFDLLGVERRQPKAEQIASVIVRADGETAYLQTPEGIAAALEMHRGIIGHKADQDQCEERCFFADDERPAGYETVAVFLDYNLKNGGHLSRMYTLPHVVGAQDDAVAAQALLNLPEAVQARKTTAFPYTAENVRFASVHAVMTAAECAAAAGFDDPADYILRELMGFAPQEIAGMSAETRDEQIRMALDGQYSDYYWKYHDDTTALYNSGVFDGGKTDWDRIWLDYTMELTAEDAWALYDSCIRPDSDDGRLGRVWVLDTDPEYAETVCMGSVEIVAERPGQDNQTATGWEDVYHAPTVSDGYTSFTTAVTVDAQRTLAFLEARGIRIHTRAEVQTEGN